MQPSLAPRWRSVPIDAIASREWDGEFVVRNERTGSSHLLGPLAGRVLNILLGADDGLAPAEISARLDPVSLGMQTSGAPDAVEAVLAEFRRLGLAELVK